MNNYTKKGLSLLIIVVITVSCKQKTTEIKEIYADGNPKKVEEYIKDKEGNKILYKETFYFPGEKKYVSGTYNNTQLRNGVWTSWYKNGKKNSEQNYVNGKEDGVYNVWHPNGKQWVKGKYKMGIKVGLWTFHDTLGNITKKEDYEKK